MILNFIFITHYYTLSIFFCWSQFLSNIPFSEEVLRCSIWHVFADENVIIAVIASYIIVPEMLLFPFPHCWTGRSYTLPCFYISTCNLRENFQLSVIATTAPFDVNIKCSWKGDFILGKVYSFIIDALSFRCCLFLSQTFAW